MPTLKHYLPGNSPGHRIISTPCATIGDAEAILKIAMEAAQHNGRTYAYIPASGGDGAAVHFSDGEYLAVTLSHRARRMGYAS